MGKLIHTRLENVQKEKLKYKKLLHDLKPEIQVNYFVNEPYEIKLSKSNFNEEKLIKITDSGRGITVQSSLPENQHKYIYFVNEDLLAHLFNYLFENQKKEAKFICPGFVIGSCKVEIHIIFIKENGERINVKGYFGENISFTIPELSHNDTIKLAIRFRNSGKVYINNLLLNDKETRMSISSMVGYKESKKIKDLNVIFIADEFTTRSFEPEFNTIKVTPTNWEEKLIGSTPDLFFCESAWLGNDGAWTNKVGTGGPRNNTMLLNLVYWCKERNIPTVFWNKEDPFHYDAFIKTAKHFDYVFTTDENSVNKYKSDGCVNVFSLPFAAQPKYHNPIEKFDRKNKVVFAGAYYGDKFPERTRAMDNMINISGKYGIDIYDRNFNNPSSPNQFPDEFKKYIIGTLKGDQIDIAYKGYKVSLNVNSIIDSPTMFSRRVFELLACNTPVVSSESMGIKKLLGDLVVASSDYTELQDRIKLLMEDEDYYKTNRLISLRTLLLEHTYKNRIEKMLQQMNFDFIKEEVSASIVGIVKSHEDYTKLIEQFNRQTYPNKKLVILLDQFEGYLDIFNNNNTKTIHTYLLDYIHHYVTINELIKTDYFAPFHEDHYYGENYITDMILATLYTEKTTIVKNQDQPYTFSTKGQLDQALIFKELTKLMSPLEFVQKMSGDSLEKSLNEYFKFGFSFFNIDDFNFIGNYRQLNDFENIILKKSI